MDPNTALNRALNIAAAIRSLADNDSDYTDTGDLIEDARNLADAIVDLDGWIRKGGFLPDDWRPETFRKTLKALKQTD